MELCSRSAKSIGEMSCRPSARFAHSAVAVPSSSGGKHSTVGSYSSTSCLGILAERAHISREQYQITVLSSEQHAMPVKGMLREPDAVGACCRICLSLGVSALTPISMTLPCGDPFGSETAFSEHGVDMAQWPYIAELLNNEELWINACWRR